MCANEYLKIFEEKELIEILKTLKSISKSRIRLKNIDETKNNFIEEINQKELMNKKHKKVCGVLTYIEYLLILVSTVTAFVSISAFAYLVGIYVGITSFPVGLKICVITAGIRSINQ